MLQNEVDNLSETTATLASANEGNFGPVALLCSVDNNTTKLIDSLQLTTEINSSVFNRLFIKDVVLYNSRNEDNFNEIIIKYKSSVTGGQNVDCCRTSHTMAKLNLELGKLNQILSNKAAAAITDFIKKLIYINSKDFIFEIEVDNDPVDFYLTMTLFSSKDYQSLKIDIF